MTATSYDIIDTANAARFRDAVEEVLIPALTKLEEVLIDIVLQEARTIQIGRTHGQHAVPITFGFAIVEYVSRVGGCIVELRMRAHELCGKFSGAVGAYNASSLFFEDPEQLEREVLTELGLAPAECSTQIVPPEALVRLLTEMAITAGVLANLADDMRNLQRTEIGEVGEEFEKAQVGSSTMPQKRNPINFENAKSCWKVIMPKIMTVFMDQISEHQRDLTNSASTRTYGELIVYVTAMTKRLTRVMAKLKVDRANMVRNLEMQGGIIAAEPLYIILAALGHPDAHEEVRKLTLQAQLTNQPFRDVVFNAPGLKPYLDKMSANQREVIAHPSLFYTGIAARKAQTVAERWKERLHL